MSDIETFFREEKERMGLPDECDEEYLARRQQTRYPGFSHKSMYFPRASIVKDIVRDEARETTGTDKGSSSKPLERPLAAHIPSQVDSQHQSSKRKQAPAQTSADPEVPMTKKRKYSAEDEELTSTLEILEMFGHTSTEAENSCRGPAGLATSAASRSRLSPSTSQRHHPTIESSAENPAEIAALAPPNTSPSIERGARLAGKDRQENTMISSSSHNGAAQDTGSSPSILPQQSGRQEKTEEGAQGATVPSNAYVSSHAGQQNVSSGSKAVAVFAEESVKAPGRSSVIRLAAPTASSSKAKTTRGKKTVGPEAKSAPAKKAGKQKPELLTPLQYAQRLQEKMADAAASGKSRGWPYLRGMRIFYYGGDRSYASYETKGHMDHIVKHGGILVPEYDPAIVTHIVTTNRPINSVYLAEYIGLRSIKQVPDHIPTVKWTYINKLWEKGGYKSPMEHSDPSVPVDYETMFHATFKNRLDAGIPHLMRKARPEPQKATNLKTRPDRPSNSPSGSKGRDDNSEISTISEFTHDRIEPKESLISDFDDSMVADRLPGPSRLPLRPQMKAAVTVRNTTDMGERKPSTGDRCARDDPLAPFYEAARAERSDEQRAEDSSDEDQRAPLDFGQKRSADHEDSKKRGFLCDSKPEEQRECVNQDIIDKLNELREVHKAKMGVEDKWRVFAYDKAIRALRSYPTRIRSFEEARAIKGVGHKTAQKIIEILQTGDLRRIGYEKTEDVAVVTLFQGIYGVGRHTAFKWYNSGCRTLDDIRARKGGIQLSACQEIGLEYYTDINSRMPRSEAGDIFDIIKPIALRIDPKLFIEIMGSYRRGKATCGDIDILITRPTSDGKTHKGVLRKLLTELRHRGIITEDLSLPESFDDLELVYRGLCRRDASSPRRRIDFLTVPYESRGAALLYYTGDDIFNRSLRLKANKMGYSLNQRGLYKGVIRNPSNRTEKLDDGILVASETEAEILQILGVPWQEPHERIRG